jgi:hypothetical protein
MILFFFYLMNLDKDPDKIKLFLDCEFYSVIFAAGGFHIYTTSIEQKRRK